ncbi:MAG: hypothetical protein AAF184_04940 [Pseudomonadota bacterium]
MPSFDAPIRAECGASRTLALWGAACDAGLVFAVIGTVCVLAGITPWVCAAACLCAFVLGWRRQVDAGARGRRGALAGTCFELHADGAFHLHSTGGAGTVLHASDAVLERRGPFLSVHGQRQARTAGDRRPRSLHLHLAADALAPDAWRRLCAWSQAGLPRPADRPSRRRS